MQTVRAAAQEAAEDLFFGQIVIIWARWFLIGAGGVLALIAAESTTQVSAAVLLLIAVMAVNFYIHARYQLEKPANRALLISIAFVDVLLITLIVAIWPGRSGLQSQFFVLYYPILFAFALVFPPRLTAIYGAFALGAYVLVCVLSRPFTADARDLEMFFTRLLTLAAMCALGTFYWRIQRQRQR